ncbi:prophage regulatory protein-like protein [Legionella geestiana]|uniref:Prophage regulatory protein-like protein n=1 Tax=Legionella geestiana TaxID=45065 RepID=A0A0W0U2L2_9GAMM|nr:AlpA family phage regulatory protein [Legionella geestiana]KTD01948.1 prophage regulatory protein-like protein [Legionella geestiana]QBS12886.1 AlpA family phage regulatory protein [Legionella geestiana]QDQ39423.1 AlpA family phage regulatory protein [Legionella geestiana]STX54624.1 prophage regulatory protein-like protein [Legionella geestiana]
MQHTEFKQQILFMRDVEQIVGRDRLTLRRWWLAGKFPRPVKLNNAVLSWHYVAIEQWIQKTMNINEATDL